MSSVDLTTAADRGVDAKLLSAARALVIALPVCYLGRITTDVDLSLVTLLFLGRSAWYRDWSWVKSGWFRIGMLLWLWTMVIGIFAVDPRLSYQQSLFWWRFLVFAAALEWWIMDTATMRRMLMVATAVLVGVGADAWLQYWSGTDLLGHPPQASRRLTGPFSDARVGSWTQRLMIPVVMGAFAWRLWERNAGAAGIALVALIVLLVGAVVLSGERMALGLTLLGLALGAWLQTGAVRKILVAGLALVAVGGVTFVATHHHFIDRYLVQTGTTLEGFEKSGLNGNPYGELWESALHLFTKRPITGVGLKNFRVACDDPALGLPPSVTNRCSTHPHNLYLEWLEGSGIVGLVLFVMLIAAWFRRFTLPLRRGVSLPWLYGPAIAVFLILWPLAPTGSFFSNWYGGIFYLEVGWALAVVRSWETGAATASSRTEGS